VKKFLGGRKTGGRGALALQSRVREEVFLRSCEANSEELARLLGLRVLRHRKMTAAGYSDILEHPRRGGGLKEGREHGMLTSLILHKVRRSRRESVRLKKRGLNIIIR